LYCDFFSDTEPAYREPYLSALVREMELRREYTGGEPLETVYFGGGTPSLLPASGFERIFEAVRRYFGMEHCREITLEANPDDMNPAYVRSLRSLPFNRISLGVQSFDAGDLLFLNRRHTREQAVRAVELCRENGFSNLSIDLMYGLPGQTAATWAANLEEALRLDVPHISAYHIIYEEGTALYRLWKEGKVSPVDEEVSVSLFTALADKLAGAGYVHYEISNFARPGYFSLHNSSYWKGEKYLGLGPSAHSYNGVSREWNVSSLPLYLKGVSAGKPDTEGETPDLPARYNEYVITRLRTVWGMRYADVSRLFGDEYLSFLRRQAEPFFRQGLLEGTKGGIRISRQGILLSDSIMRELLRV
jgi:oxygen-independent coproporphyrinogen-3 oxidase